jgi:hypothetical protein
MCQCRTQQPGPIKGRDATTTLRLTSFGGSLGYLDCDTGLSYTYQCLALPVALPCPTLPVAIADIPNQALVRPAGFHC